MSREKQIEDQSEVLYGGRREGGKRFAEMCAKAFENAEAHPENYDDMFAGYENDLNKAVALIEWQKQEIESLTIRMNAFGLAIKSLAEERSKYFLLKENGDVVPLAKQSEWISVEERLPEPEKEVLVLAIRKYKYGNGEVPIITTAMYEDGTMSTEDSCWNWYDIDFIYDEDNDIQYIPEGWWEYRHYNPDDVYNNAVDDKVTHWMPLPEAPKMKGGGE